MKAHKLPIGLEKSEIDGTPVGLIPVKITLIFVKMLFDPIFLDSFYSIIKYIGQHPITSNP